MSRRLYSCRPSHYCPPCDEVTIRTPFDELVKYHSIHNNCNVSRFVPHLGEWVNNKRRSKRIYDAGKKCGLTVKRVNKLNTLGFEWSLSP